MMDPHSLTLYSRRVTIRRRDSRHAPLVHSPIPLPAMCRAMSYVLATRLRITGPFSRPTPPPLSIATPFPPGWANESTVAVPAFVATPLAAAACTAAHVPRAWILSFMNPQIFDVPPSLKRKGHPGLEPRLHAARPCSLRLGRSSSAELRPSSGDRPPRASHLAAASRPAAPS